MAIRRVQVRCWVCRNLFYATSGGSRYCSEACRAEGKAEYKRTRISLTSRFFNFEKICPDCRKPNSEGTIYHRACSDKRRGVPRLRVVKARPAKKAKKSGSKTPKAKICRTCKERFIPNHSNRAYCSIKCRADAARKKGQRYTIKQDMPKGQYEEVLESQGGVCAICGGDDGKRSLAVDHDHATEKIRGLLCSRCNMGIGAFGDSAPLMRDAATYLERTTNPQFQPKCFVG